MAINIRYFRAMKDKERKEFYDKLLDRAYGKGWRDSAKSKRDDYAFEKDRLDALIERLGGAVGVDDDE